MMYRRIAALVLALIALTGSALAASLLVEQEGTAGQVLQIQSASSYGFHGNTQYLLDQQPSTFFIRSAGENDAYIQYLGIDVTLTMQGWETVDGLWIRSGACSDQAAFEYYARPAVLRVTIHHQGGKSEFRYLMADEYQPYAWNSSWQNGYQRLSLPQAFSRVTQIDLYCETWYKGSTAKDSICISDIQVTGSGYQGSIPPYTPNQPVYPPYTPNPYQPGAAFTLTQKLATRSGPGTDYDEMGTFLQPGDTVTLLSRAYSSRDRIWWVQAEFTYQGMKRRVYTGAKRIREDTSSLPVESAQGTGAVLADAQPFNGPGSQYEPLNITVRAGQWGTVWACENGYVQFEYQDTDWNCCRRVWLPQSQIMMN